MKTNLLLILALTILLLVSCTTNKINTENSADKQNTNTQDNNQPSVDVTVEDTTEDDNEPIQIQKADLDPNNGHTGTIAKVKLRFCYKCSPIGTRDSSRKDIDFDLEAETIDIKTNPLDGQRPGGKTITFDSEEAEDLINALTKKHGIKLDDYERSVCKVMDVEPGDLTIVYKTTRRILVEEDLCVTADPALNKFYTEFIEKVYRKYYPKEQDLGIAFADSSWSGPTIDRSADDVVYNPYRR